MQSCCSRRNAPAGYRMAEAASAPILLRRSGGFHATLPGGRKTRPGTLQIMSSTGRARPIASDALAVQTLTILPRFWPAAVPTIPPPIRMHRIRGGPCRKRCRVLRRQGTLPCAQNWEQRLDPHRSVVSEGGDDGSPDEMVSVQCFL